MKKGDCKTCDGTGLVPRETTDHLFGLGPAICLTCDGTGGKYGNRAGSGVSVEKQPETPKPSGGYYSYY